MADADAADCDAVTAARIHVESSDSASNYTYGMYFTTAACRFWNESTDAWDTAGCTVYRPAMLTSMHITTRKWSLFNTRDACNLICLSTILSREQTHCNIIFRWL